MPMTLRSRLVAALAILLLVGLAGFGVVTYGLYARTQYQQLDEQLRSAISPVSGQLLDNAGISGGHQDGPTNGAGNQRQGKPSVIAPTGSYAELHDATGALVTGGRVQVGSTESTPDLTGTLPARGKIMTVGSETGSGSWRLTTADAFGQPGYTVVVALPDANVTRSLNRLVLIEALSGLALLTAVASGAWFILRRGLRPLENMAESARSINAGDLSQRVAPADGRSEVGQLGLALNTMLGEIEQSFTERDATEQRLRRFLSDVSHELRTPLTSIQGFAELFRLGINNDHVDQGVIMRRIEQESARMKRLVEDLLLLARLDETRPVDRQSVDLSVLAADACSDAAATDPTRQISLDAPDPVVVAGDRDHLRQAIANLVANALKHTPDGTALEVRAGIDGQTATIIIRDHGPGLTEEALAHVFDRFWQADTARVGSGAGLGLSIVSAIAHEHGGTATLVAAGTARGLRSGFVARIPFPHNRCSEHVSLPFRVLEDYNFGVLLVSACRFLSERRCRSPRFGRPLQTTQLRGAPRTTRPYSGRPSPDLPPRCAACLAKL
jgi:two-component system, OmpR family, sensor kinase